jgi:pyruvate kinase
MEEINTSCTKIVCTIGPKVNTPEMIESLIKSGMNVARINFSHGTHEEHGEVIARIRNAAKKLDKPVAILQDLSGPKLRIGAFKNDAEIMLKTGDRFILSSKEIEGDEKGVSFVHPEVIKDVKPGETILLADGIVSLKVLKVDGEGIHTEALNDSKLSSHKGVNFPHSKIKIPSLTEKDKKDLEFGIKTGVDFIALSFVREPEDILNLKNIISFFNEDIPVIAKIEKHEAVDNLEEIVKITDGLMVARGDLGVEVPLEKVPFIQKRIIHLANLYGKPVITATQMLRSMVENPRPTRAEATDVANAIWDGTDAVMLSEETAVGKYPLEAVGVLKTIAKETEKEMELLDKRHRAFPEMLHETVRDAIATGVFYLSSKLNPKVIITPTITGTTPRLISRLQPSAPVVAFTPNEVTYRRLALSWGVFPYLSKHYDSFRDLINLNIKRAAEEGWLSHGDKAIIALGYPPGEERTDTIKVVEY